MLSLQSPARRTRCTQAASHYGTSRSLSKVPVALDLPQAAQPRALGLFKNAAVLAQNARLRTGPGVPAVAGPLVEFEGTRVALRYTVALFEH